MTTSPGASESDASIRTDGEPSQDTAATESGTVRTNDIDTYYERRGEGPPVVFVHSMAMNTGQWAAQVDALADEYTTVAYDVRGHGHTGGSDRSSYSMELYVSDLDALLTELAVERPVLVGLSMGGCIAQAYAAAHPEKVAGLVLSDTFVTGRIPLKARLLFRNLRFMGLLDRVVRYTTLNRIQLWVGNRLSPGIAGESETIQRVIEAEPTIPHAEFRKIARSVATFPGTDLDLSAVTVPTLITCGEHVPAVMRDMHTRLATQLTNADVEVRTVPDAGHASNIDNPDFFTAAVREFADRIGEQ